MDGQSTAMAVKMSSRRRMFCRWGGAASMNSSADSPCSAMRSAAVRLRRTTSR